MKSKLLFAAALVAAGVVGTQAVRLANSSWSLQLLENRQLWGVNPLAADEAEARGVQALSYEGEAVVSGQVYYLYNVGAGKFLEGGSDFGTFATFAEIGVPITFTSVGDNLYTLNTGMGSGFLNAEGWMDQTADKANLTLTPVDGKENVYNLGTGTAYFGYDGSAAKMSVNVSDASSDNAQWILVSKSQREGKLAQATAESGVDASFFLANPNFSRNVNPFGWTNDNNVCGQLGNDDDKLMEIYNKKDANFYQSLSGLPNGVYVVSCLGFYRNGDAQPAADSKDKGIEKINVFLYAGNNEAPFASILDGFGKTTTGTMTVTLGGEEGNLPNWPAEAASDFRAGIYSRTEVPVVVTDGNLTLGVRKSVLSTNDWTQFDSFRLTYYGNTAEAMQQALQDKVDEAHALAEAWDGTVPTTYVTQLEAVTAKSCADASAYSAAIGEINGLESEVYTVRNSFIPGYMEAKIYAESMLTAFPNAEESAKEALTQAIAEADAKAFASTEAAVWAEATAPLETACKAYYEATDGMLADGVKNFDVTDYMVQNPGFEAEDPLTGWEGLNASDIIANAEGTAHTVRKGGSNWRVSQTVNVPNGLYSMSAQIGYALSDRHYLFLESSYQRQQLMYKWNGSGNGESNENILANWGADEEAQRSSVGNVLVTDGKIVMGVDWIKDSEVIAFDNFRLVRVSDGAAEIKNAYSSLKEEGEGFVETLPTVLKQQLQEALAKSPEDGAATAAYYEAYNVLVPVMEECRPAAKSVAKLVPLIEECQAYAENSVTTSATREAFEGVLETAEGYMAATDAETLEAYYNDLEAARQTFVQNAVPTGEQEFDMTFLLTNPDLTNLPAWSQQAGWYTDTDKGIQCMENAEVASEDGKSHFYEIYAGSKTPMPAGNILYQKVVLKPGDYRMSAYAYGKGVNDRYTGAFSGCLFADEAKGETFAYDRLTQSEVSFTQAAEKEIKLGLYSDGTGAANWAGIGYMKLYKVAPEATDLVLNEASAYSVTSDTYADVTMARKLGAGKWNTFCVPFDMTADQLTANKITKVVQLTAAETTADNGINLTSTDVTDGVKAGVPYLVQVSEDVTEITAEGVYVTAAAPAAQTIGTAGDYTVAMTGNYSAMTVPTDAYFISGNTFYVADAEAEVALKGFRAYITLTAANGEPAAVNVRSISIDGSTAGDGTTGIEGVSGETADRMVDVYTLSGVKVKGGVKASEALDGLQRGVYIVNGKKIIK